jgi:hypothetical protein
MSSTQDYYDKLNAVFGYAQQLLKSNKQLNRDEIILLLALICFSNKYAKCINDNNGYMAKITEHIKERLQKQITDPFVNYSLKCVDLIMLFHCSGQTGGKLGKDAVVLRREIEELASRLHNREKIASIFGKDKKKWKELENKTKEILSGNTQEYNAQEICNILAQYAEFVKRKAETKYENIFVGKKKTQLSIRIGQLYEELMKYCDAKKKSETNNANYENKKSQKKKFKYIDSYIQ